tara:strand:+ start:15335 stop:15775 length:441 start_codon:yes stop_codon:yes gene_type:complete
MVKSKKEHGWIRIVEAFAMILLIAGIFLIILDKDSPESISQEIYEKEQGILREVQLNDSLREDILNLNIGSLPVEWNDTNFPQNLKDKIISKTPSYLNCEAKICKTDNNCVLSESKDENTYTQEVLIASTINTYSPRKIKLFCWER